MICTGHFLTSILYTNDSRGGGGFMERPFNFSMFLPSDRHTKSTKLSWWNTYEIVQKREGTSSEGQRLVELFERIFVLFSKLFLWTRKIGNWSTSVTNSLIQPFWTGFSVRMTEKRQHVTSSTALIPSSFGCAVSPPLTVHGRKQKSGLDQLDTCESTGEQRR